MQMRVNEPHAVSFESFPDVESYLKTYLNNKNFARLLLEYIVKECLLKKTKM